MYWGPIVVKSKALDGPDKERAVQGSFQQSIVFVVIQLRGLLSQSFKLQFRDMVSAGRRVSKEVELLRERVKILKWWVRERTRERRLKNPLVAASVS